MATYGYINGKSNEQIEIQRELLLEEYNSSEELIISEEQWIDFISQLEGGDTVVVVALSRLGATEAERAARQEMLELIGVNLVTLTSDFQKGFR